MFEVHVVMQRLKSSTAYKQGLWNGGVYTFTLTIS